MLGIGSLIGIPLIASFTAGVLKLLMSFCTRQTLNGRGHPSGHTAVIVSLIVTLSRDSPESNYALAAVVVFGTLYLSDICLFYYCVDPAIVITHKEYRWWRSRTESSLNMSAIGCSVWTRNALVKPAWL